MPQAHCFLATELMLKAQAQAQQVTFADLHRIRRVASRRNDGSEPDDRRDVGDTRRYRVRSACRNVAARVPRRLPGRASPRPSIARRLSRHRAGIGARRQRRRATASTSARSAPAASRAGTICRDCGSTTRARIMAVCDLDSQRVDDAQDAGQRLLRASRPASRTTASPATPTTASCSPTRTSTPS